MNKKIFISLISLLSFGLCENAVATSPPEIRTLSLNTGLDVNITLSGSPASNQQLFYKVYLVNDANKGVSSGYKLLQSGKIDKSGCNIHIENNINPITPDLSNQPPFQGYIEIYGIKAKLNNYGYLNLRLPILFNLTPDHVYEAGHSPWPSLVCIRGKYSYTISMPNLGGLMVAQISDNSNDFFKSPHYYYPDIKPYIARNFINVNLSLPYQIDYQTLPKSSTSFSKTYDFWNKSEDPTGC